MIIKYKNKDQIIFKKEFKIFNNKINHNINEIKDKGLYYITKGIENLINLTNLKLNIRLINKLIIIFDNKD